MTILVTGASGFVGQALCRRLASLGRDAVAAVRRTGTDCAGLPQRLVGALGPDTDWSAALDGVDTVIHLAGRAHVMRDHSTDPLAEFRRVNAAGTRALAEQAAGRVRRLVLVSTIKVNGETTDRTNPFTAADRPAPVEPYAVAKAEGEDALRDVAAHHGLEAVIVRPPLVHGPDVKGNLATLLRILKSGLPLPLGAVNNARSLVGVDNLCDLLIRCADHPAAAGQTLLVKDDGDPSTPDLLRRLAQAMGRKPRLLPVPPALLRAAAALVGKAGMAERLLDSLVVDDTSTRALLDWAPPLTLDQGLAAMATAYCGARP